MSPHRILFGLLSPVLGGHTRTAVALAEALRQRGHTVDIVVRADLATTPECTDAPLRAAGLTVVPIGGLYAGLKISAFRRNLRHIVQRGGYDVIHWFEFYDGVRDAALVARDTGAAFVWTVTSGGVPVGYHGLNRVVVFTPEVAADVRRRSPGTLAYVLPARFDFRDLTAEGRVEARASVRPMLGLDDRDLLIVRVARCASLYLHSVRLGIDLAVRLHREGHRAAFLHVGYVHEPDVADEIRRLVAAANVDAGRTIAFSLTERLETGTHYASAADVCIGSGRSAIEAIALERPTLVSWGSRYLGIVDEGNIGSLADTNFQGRQSAHAPPDADVVEQMHRAVGARLADPDAAASVQAACARFVRARYSAQGAADIYERLYADRTVTVSSTFRHFTSPDHMGRELLRRLPEGLTTRGPIGRLRRSRAQRDV